nr:MAG TPA: hypothetical protein [Caudoviricetes sp.]
MAVGDIKKIGTLQINEVKYEQSQIIECAINTNFTFVDDSTGNYDWEWIEANLNGTKAYISKASPLHGMSPNNMLGQCKKVTLGGILYRIALISANDWINLPKTVLAKMLKIGAFDFDVTTSDFFYRTGMDRDEVRIVTLKFDYVIDNGSFPANSAGQNLYYWPVLIVDNNVPIISGEDENLGNKTSSFNITYSVSDADAGQELTVKEKLNGSIIRTLKNPTQNSTLTFTITDELFVSLSMNTTNTIEIEVTDGSATTYRRYTFVKTNSAPFITYTGQADLGELTTKPSITYSVKDNEGDAITVTEKLNGEVINQFSATSNTNYTVGITDTFWLTCGSNTNTVEIIASDALGGSSSKTITFSRKIMKLQIVMKNAIETDAKATKILVSPQWTTSGGVGKVEVCNNGFDSNPTWEDATTMVVLNRPYLFTNSSKTASKWGIKIRITVTKNQGYDGEVAIFGFGGAYE